MLKRPNGSESDGGKRVGGIRAFSSFLLLEEVREEERLRFAFSFSFSFSSLSSFFFGLISKWTINYKIKK